MTEMGISRSGQTIKWEMFYNRRPQLQSMFCSFCQHQRDIFSFHFCSIICSANSTPWGHAAVPTCFKRAGGVRATELLAAGALHPELVLWSWSEISLGYCVNIFSERVPVASVFALTLARVDTHSRAHAHFDSVDHADLRAPEIQACGVCAEWKGDCYQDRQWIYGERVGEINEKSLGSSTGFCVTLTSGQLSAGAPAPVLSFKRDHADLVRLTWSISA